MVRLDEQFTKFEERRNTVLVFLQKPNSSRYLDCIAKIHLHQVLCKAFLHKDAWFLVSVYVNALLSDWLTVQFRYYLIKMKYEYSAMYFGAIVVIDFELKY